MLKNAEALMDAGAECQNCQHRQHPTLCGLWEATKKKVKKVHNKCELSPKMENPPPPISQQF